MEKVRFGIVGCGNMGGGHAKNFMNEKITNGVLTAACDIRPERLESMKEICGDSVK